jgi:predicted O-linked N-acetylglucosamine transferase (SPINDLY family)
MLNPNIIDTLPLWQQQACEHFLQEEYIEASVLYEQAIATTPEVSSYYWYLGLIQFLQDQQADAETTWFLPMLEQEELAIEQMRAELADVLLTEIDRQVELEHFSTALPLCTYVQELTPEHVNNFLKIIQLKIKFQRFDQEDDTFLQLIELLNSKYPLDFDANQMLTVIQSLLSQDLLGHAPYVLSKACLPYADHVQTLVGILSEAQMKILLTRNLLAIAYAELCLSFQKPTPSNLEFLSRVYIFSETNLLLGIDLVKLAYRLASRLDESIIIHGSILSALLKTGSRWQEVKSNFQEHKQLLSELTSQLTQDFEYGSILNLFGLAFLAPHIEDKPEQNRPIYNQISQLCQANIEKCFSEEVNIYRLSPKNTSRFKAEQRSLKIGYLSANLKMHPIGLLARWLFQNHDLNRFEIYTYHINCPTPIIDPLQNWYVSQGSCGRVEGLSATEIAKKIYQDEIDILIDLESNTFDISCAVMAIKPAPIQATWLGFDASGVPAVDYFIADPYVLPDSAQDYYTEKIWRLPHTYLAIGGFEVSAPTLRRDQLDIPSDAVIFFSAQRANKRHPQTVRLQMQIIKSVPNSYFLIKGRSNKEFTQEFFYEIASQEGVGSDRLRFLPMDPAEETHRANLSIADVVLDTYPYNGATTTLEALWMGIPMVTRVGEQFSARNSYTFMVNANITEGIAWTDEEYVEWGIRLGTDENLRKQVHWKLLTSRQTAPLWNAEQFAREMENAYQQMWQDYIQKL